MKPHEKVIAELLARWKLDRITICSPDAIRTHYLIVVRRGERWARHLETVVALERLRLAPERWFELTVERLARRLNGATMN